MARKKKNKMKKNSNSESPLLKGSNGEANTMNYNAITTTSGVPDEVDTLTGLLSDTTTASSSRSSNVSTEMTNGNCHTKFAKAARRLSASLVQCNDDEDLEKAVLMKTLNLDPDESLSDDSSAGISLDEYERSTLSRSKKALKKYTKKLMYKTGAVETLATLISIALIGLVAIFALFVVGNLLVGPPKQPVGRYKLVDLQEGEDFFSHYIFYNGQDSEGSNGYINYVSREEAFRLGIANVTLEEKNGRMASDLENDEERRVEGNTELSSSSYEPFVYMSTSPTEAGPRNSVRLEGLKRYNRGLFIIDLRHMPAGCGTWPAFWLTDEANWPVNGEIDLIEGVNTQKHAKTALHTTQVCTMDDVPQGVKTGSWDTAVGVPKKNGELDMTVREARDCFVYDPHQWLNQGCVAINDDNETIGEPFNKKGGGVYVLEWDPVNRFMKSWVFTPHTEMPENLRQTMDTANNQDISKRVAPDPTSWPLPYAYFPIGTGTNCPSSHFRNMRLVFNMALCGSVAGNRFFMDCPILNEKYGTCENYIANNTDAMNEIFWKIRGVYVFEREWERSWAS